MAIKATDQVSIVDITDAYTVLLTSESYTFAGDTTYAKAGSCTTQVVALRGDDPVLVSVGTCPCPAGVTASISGNGTATPTITFTVAGGTISDTCEVTIPLTVDGDIEFTKKFTISVAKQGTKGDKGTNGTDGKDAITVSITSSAGFIFKNASIATTLTAHVYQGGKELTSQTTPTLASVGTIKWYKDSGTTAVATGQTLTIAAGDVTNKATYTAKVEG